MAFCWQSFLLLSLVATILVNADVKLDCGHDFVTLTWKDIGSQLDTSLIQLGNCLPTRFSPGEAVFNVWLTDCNFRRMVTGDQIVYSNDLSYFSAPNDFNNEVACTYNRPEDWYPPTYDPVVFDTFGQADLVFHMDIMNGDFSGPAISKAFPLGSLIPISAAVDQKSHQPLLLLLEECVATPTPELQPDSQSYSIITNGCLMDSKKSRSRFEPRVRSSEIRLSLQAFKFSEGEEVYIHCKLVAWDPKGLDDSKKACHHVRDYGWELLDDPSRNSLCGCCDNGCFSRKTRSTDLGKVFTKEVVLGPLNVSKS